MSTDNARIASKRVSFCLRKGRDYLNLNGLGLTRLPDDFVKLTGLRYLDLSGNQLTELPEEITTFTNLRWFGFNDNRLESLPEQIGALTRLERLYLRNNRLEALPKSIGDLSHLLELDLSSNRIVNLPKSFAKLLKVTTERRSELYFGLDGNPGQVAAVAKQGSDSLAEYLESLEDIPEERISGKLLLVGEGGVGKSTLLRALLGQEFRKLSTTHGLNMEGLDLKPGEDKISLNCWDFSGQVEMRETHQLFFTAPAIYLLVWNARLGEHMARLSDWLWLIKHRTNGTAKVLIVATECAQHAAELDQTETLLSEFGGPDGILVDSSFLAVECNPKSPGGERNIEELRQALLRIIHSDSLFRQSSPPNWQACQDAISRDRGTTPFLPWRDFEAYCRRHGIEDAKGFAGTNHRLGRLVWIDRGALSNTVILNPDWLSKAIGFVLHARLDTESKDAARGMMANETIEKLWTNPPAVNELQVPEKGYEPDTHPTFHRIMQDFDLAHPIRGPEGRPSRLIPNRMSSKKPETWGGHWDSKTTGVCRRIELLGYDNAPLNDWLSSSFFYRLMVRLHPHTLGRDDYRRAAHWRYGFRLSSHSYGHARLTRSDSIIYFESQGTLPVGLWANVDLAIQELKDELTEEYGYEIRTDVLVPCASDCERSTEDRRYYEESWVSDYYRDDPHARIKCDHRPKCGRMLEIQTICAGIQGSSLDRKLDRIESKVDGIRDHNDSIAEEFRSNFQEILHWQGDRPDDSATLERFQSLEANLRRHIDMQFTGLRVSLNSRNSPQFRAPALFSVVPADPNFWTDKGNIFEKKLRLYLHCEHCLLPVTWMEQTEGKGEFELKQNRAWWQKAAPYIRSTSRLLAMFAPTTALLGHEDWGDNSKNYKQLAQEMEKLIDATKDWVDSDGAETSGSHRKADGIALQWLHQVLVEKTGCEDLVMAQRQLGLTRVFDKGPQIYRWVHIRYENLYTN